MAMSRKVLTAGAAGVAALALIGAGANATFTDSTTSNQNVQAGTIDMVLSASNATGGNNSKTLTLPTVGPTNSTFKSDPTQITMTNNGTVQADAIYLGISSTPVNGPGVALKDQLSVCITSGASIIYNGTVTGLQAMGGGLGQQIAGPFGPGGSDVYAAEFYAGSKAADNNGNGALGQAATLCKGLTYGGAYAAPESLTDAAQGGLVGTSITVKYVG